MTGTPVQLFVFDRIEAEAAVIRAFGRRYAGIPAKDFVDTARQRAIRARLTRQLVRGGL